MYAMERTEEHIRIWFWTRDEVRCGAVPADLLAMGLEGGGAVNNADEGRRINTDGWVRVLCHESIAPFVDIIEKGAPVALFPSTRQCDLKRKFGPNSIIINLTFCASHSGPFSYYTDDLKVY